jgi:hypothetical protein
VPSTSIGKHRSSFSAAVWFRCDTKTVFHGSDTTLFSVPNPNDIRWMREQTWLSLILPESCSGLLPAGEASMQPAGPSYVSSTPSFAQDSVVSRRNGCSSTGITLYVEQSHLYVIVAKRRHMAYRSRIGPHTKSTFQSIKCKNSALPVHRCEPSPHIPQQYSRTTFCSE